MKTANNALISLLGSNDQFLMCDIFTFSLNSGDEYRWTTADIDITYNGNLYKSGSSLIQRNNIKNVVGVVVDALNVTLYPSSADTVSNIKLSTAILSLGFFDNAKVELRKLFLTDWKVPPVGDLILFMGNVSDVQGTGTQIDIAVKSKLEILNQQIPRNVYQTACLNSIYDSQCTINNSAYTDYGYVSSATASSIVSTLSKSDSYYRQGVLEFTSGVNIGVRRTVKEYYRDGTFTFSLPLPNVPSANDSFHVYPGCDGTMSTCEYKFNNLIHFRGFPYIPVPETSI